MSERQPGPELDEKLATLIGWDTNPELHERDEASDGYSQCNRCGRVASWSESLGPLCMPRYSDYVELAIQAAEEMREAGRIQYWSIERDDLSAIAEAYGVTEHKCYAETPAHALTLALLNALESKP